MDTEITFISKEVAIRLHQLGYSIGVLLNHPATDAYLKRAFDANISDTDMSDICTYYELMGYTNAQWFINTDIYQTGGLHISFADGSNPFVSYYLHGRTLEDMLKTLDAYKREYNIASAYVKNSILYVYLEPIHTRVQEAFL